MMPGVDEATGDTLPAIASDDPGLVPLGVRQKR